MKKSSPISASVIFGFVALLAVVIFVGWKLSGPTGGLADAPPPPANAPKAAAANSAPPAPVNRPPTITSNLPQVPVEQPPAPRMQETPKTPEEAAAEAADYKIGMIIEQEQTPEATRDKLLLLFPNFTPVEKVAAAPHIVNLTGDEDLPRMLPFLKNPLTPPEAMESFFNDMLNRPPELGWPVLVELIGTPRHPMEERAKEIMTTIVGDDYGNDVNKWMEGLRAQLEQQGLELPPASGAPAAPQP